MMRPINKKLLVELLESEEEKSIMRVGLIRPQSITRSHASETALGEVLAIADDCGDIDGVQVGSQVILRDSTVEKNGKWYNPHMFEEKGKKLIVVDKSDILALYEI